MSEERTKLGQKIAIVLGSLSVLVAIVAIIVHVKTRPPDPPQPEPDFAVSVTPMQGNAPQGTVTSTSVNVQSQWEYDHTVQLSSPGKPDGVHVSFSPQSKLPTFPSTMTVNVGERVKPGDYMIEIKGMGADGTEHTCKYALTVTRKPADPPPVEKPPEATIIDPKSDATVPMAMTIVGMISGEIPEDRYMWIVINPHTSPGQWWPQGGRVQPWGGQWNAPAILGREQEDKGVKFDIALILLDEEDNKGYETYLERGATTEDYSGKPLPRSATLLQKITVTRE